MLRFPKILSGVLYTSDISKVLYSTEWVVYNDTEDNVLLSFERNGQLIVSRNGEISKGKWNYDIENEMVIWIRYYNLSYRLVTGYVDDNIVVLHHSQTIEWDGEVSHCLKSSDEYEQLKSFLFEGPFDRNIYMIAKSKQGALSLFTYESIIEYFRDKALFEAIVEEVFKQKWHRLLITYETLQVVGLILIIFIGILIGILTTWYVILVEIVSLAIGCIGYWLLKRTYELAKCRLRKKEIEFRQFLKNLKHKSTYL